MSPSATDLTRGERHALADLLARQGPDVPTLCGTWTTRDLAAHLVVREARLDAALGIVLPPLAGWTEKVQARAAARPYDDLVAAVRNGPPTLSVFALPGVEGQANLLEYFVHHEDVRRGGATWTARDLDADLRDAVWGKLKGFAPRLFHGAPVGVQLARTDGPGGADDRIGAHGGQPVVTLTGATGELVLAAFGRAAVDVDVTGDDEALAAYGEFRPRA